VGQVLLDGQGTEVVFVEGVAIQVDGSVGFVDHLMSVVVPGVDVDANVFWSAGG
jgi:hypothetical protein